MVVLVLKKSKLSAFPLRVVVVLFTMIIGMYTCYISIHPIQLDSEDKGTLASSQVWHHTCDLATNASEDAKYIHYPQPKTYSRNECSCNPVKFFAIVTMQRSGSGWFETLLNSHPNISSNGEVFHKADRRANASSILKTLDTLYNLDYLTSASKNECTAAFGLKWMLNQGLMSYHDEVASYFESKGVSLIFLFRRNSLRRIVSLVSNNYDKQAKLLNGTHKSHVHTKEEASILANYKPVLDTSTLVSKIRTAEKEITTCLQHFNSTRHMVLYYEDIIGNEAALVRVQRFLGVPVRKLVSRQVKIHTRPITDLIENWKEVSDTLNGTAYSHLLDESDYHHSDGAL